MKNYIQDGNVLTLTAPTGGVVSGGIYKIGLLAVVAAYSAAATEEFEGTACGVFELPKLSADVLAEGAVAVLKASSGEIDNSGTDGSVGIVVEAAGNGDTTVKVKLVQDLQ